MCVCVCVCVCVCGVATIVTIISASLLPALLFDWCPKYKFPLFQPCPKHRVTVTLVTIFEYIILTVLKPTGHVMHHQFNIQQLYALPTLYLCVLYLSENKQRLVPLTA